MARYSGINDPGTPTRARPELTTKPQAPALAHRLRAPPNSHPEKIMLTTTPILDTTDYLLKAQTLPLEMASYAATIWFAWMLKPWSGVGSDQK